LFVVQEPAYAVHAAGFSKATTKKGREYFYASQLADAQ
jgi:hypothetical protein